MPDTMPDIAPVRHVICCSEIERIPALVMKYTIVKNCSRDCDVRLSYEMGCENPPGMPNAARPRTNFSYHRMCVPKLLGFEGRVIVSDSDMLVYADEAEIFDAPMLGGCNVLSACPLGKPHQNSSVMVVDCAKVAWDIDVLAERIRGGTLDYGRMMRLEDIGVKWESVDHEWNSLDRWAPNRTKLLHYTDMGRQPWKKGQHAHPHSSNWFNALEEAMDAGAVAREDVEKAVVKQHLHPHCGTLARVH